MNHAGADAESPGPASWPGPTSSPARRPNRCPAPARTLGRGLLWLAVSLVAIHADASRLIHDVPADRVVAPSMELVVAGTNTAGRARIVVVRMDDRDRPGYAQRVNVEREVEPGPFRFRVPLGGLTTPSGRRFALDRLTRVHVFQGRGSGDLDLLTPRFVAGVTLPVGAEGWDLGAAEGPLQPGFRRLVPGDAAFVGGRPVIVDRSRRRQAVDPLVDDGVKGIRRLVLPLAPGEWHVTLWLRDAGEWEYLPHILERRIKANGTTVDRQALSPRSWQDSVYLAGKYREAGPEDDAWSLFGRRPESMLDFVVTVGDAGLVLDFDGQQPEAGYLAAVVAERDASRGARRIVQADRASRWRENWSVSRPRAVHDPSPSVALSAAELTIAPGTGGSLVARIEGTTPDDAPLVAVRAPALRERALTVQQRWGAWHLRRRTPSGTGLQLVDDRLVHGLMAPVPARGMARSVHLRIRVPADTKPGEYTGSLRVHTRRWTSTVPLKVRVPEVRLPAADRPIGVYLEKPVHFGWFEATAKDADAAGLCDLAFLRREGLTGLAPPLRTPLDDAGASAFEADLRRAESAGFRTPLLAYAPFKRLARTLGVDGAAARVAEIETRLRALGLARPLWAIADEPGNPGSESDPLRIARHLRARAPHARLAGQLNHPADVRALAAFDTVLVNAAFGVSARRLDELRARGVSPWLYNMESFRAAAGFFLWRSGAEGYLQWHARMPTADPFDPTDGREDDMQFLLPGRQPCPAVHDVDASLFELAEGVVDLRWALWLEARALDDSRAMTELDRLRREVPTDWETMALLEPRVLDRWRARIVALAR